MTEKCFEERFRDVEENYKVITNRIAEAAVRSGRKPEDITFLAATKTVPAEVINHAIGCGLRFIGENRVQEFMDKYEKIDWDKGVSGQIIGRLQTNKVKYIIDKVDCIQSVDSVKLAKEISRLAEKIGRKMPVLIEVNIGGEESKGGIEKAALPALLEEIAVLPGIQVNGLMAIPPICAEKSARRGQNYQLMLPVCYKFPHAFLDEPLYGYVKYQNGMSAGDVTETDKLRRIAEHETILLQTAKQIKMPEAEYQKCLDEIEKRYALQRFYTAIDFRNKVLLQEQYAILKKYGAVTRDIKKLYRRNRTVLHKLCFKFYEGGKNYVQNFSDRARL